MVNKPIKHKRVVDTILRELDYFSEQTKKLLDKEKLTSKDATDIIFEITFGDKRRTSKRDRQVYYSARKCIADWIKSWIAKEMER